MTNLKKAVTIFLCAALACLPASAQFVPGQVLNASALNAALAAPRISGGSIDNAPIGGTTPSSGRFTTINGTTAVFTTTYGDTFVGLGFQASLNEVLLKATPTGALHIGTSQTTPPTCASGCGATPTIVGTDSAMILTMGSTGTPTSGFVINFNKTWAALPACIGQMAKSGMVVGKLPIVASPTATGIVVTTNGTSPSTSDIYAFHCLGVS